MFASLFEEETPYEYMEFPRHQWNAMYASKVLDGDKLIGVATSRGYSYYFRKMISHVVIDVAYSEPGTELELIWAIRVHGRRRSASPWRNRRSSRTTAARI